MQVTLLVLPLWAGLTAGSLVGLIALGHLAWALGVPWPARDRAQLVAHVFPSAGAARLRFRLPGRAITLFVSAVFFAMSACLVAPQLTSHVLPGGQWPVYAIASIFALRGLFGLFYWSRRRETPTRSAVPSPTPSPFYLYNRVLYSPGCLFIAALAAVSATSLR